MQAEKEVVSAKEECIQVHEANQTLEKEVSLTSLIVLLPVSVKWCHM